MNSGVVGAIDKLEQISPRFCIGFGRLNNEKEARNLQLTKEESEKAGFLRKKAFKFSAIDQKHSLSRCTLCQYCYPFPSCSLIKSGLLWMIFYDTGKGRET